MRGWRQASDRKLREKQQWPWRWRGIHTGTRVGVISRGSPLAINRREKKREQVAEHEGWKTRCKRFTYNTSEGLATALGRGRGMDENYNNMDNSHNRWIFVRENLSSSQLISHLIISRTYRDVWWTWIYQFTHIIKKGYVKTTISI